MTELCCGRSVPESRRWVRADTESHRQSASRAGRGNLPFWEKYRDPVSPVTVLWTYWSPRVIPPCEKRDNQGGTASDSSLKLEAASGFIYY